MIWKTSPHEIAVAFRVWKHGDGGGGGGGGAGAGAGGVAAVAAVAAAAAVCVDGCFYRLIHTLLGWESEGFGFRSSVSHLLV